MTNGRDGNHDLMIKYGFYIGIFFALACLTLTIAYMTYYSFSIETAFESHFNYYLTSDVDHLKVIMLSRTALNKTLLLSCGIVSGIAFGFVGLSLFLLGIKGDIKGSGAAAGYTVSFERLAPGGLVIVAALVLIGVCAIHKIELDMSVFGTAPGSTAQDNSTNTQSGPGASNTWNVDHSNLWGKSE